MFTTKLIKKNGKLEYLDLKDKTKYKLFLEKVSENGVVEVFFNIESKKASVAQISKVHACIRQIAGELGNSFDEMKHIIKMKAGLLYLDGNDNVIEKSFSDCSKEELNSAIQACEELAQNQGIILG